MATPFHRLEECLGEGGNDDQRIPHDLEVDFDSVGIAKCCHCGVKLPADIASIEQHSKVCSAERSSGRHWSLGLDVHDNGWCGVGKPTQSCMLTSDGETTQTHDPGELDHRDLSAEIDPDEDSSVCLGVDDADAPEALLDDWEDDLDAIGIATCSHCGAKLPANEEAIEEHLKHCQGEGRRQPKALLCEKVQPNFGKCCRCQQRISLEVEDVVAHSQVCPALRALPRPPERSGYSALDSAPSWWTRWGCR